MQNKTTPRRFVIEGGRTEGQYWRDLWSYRELFLVLAWRDFLLRYRQTVVGIAWALIRPVIIMLVLTVVGKVGNLPSGGVPFPLFVLCAMLPWQFFSTAISESGGCLVNNSNLVSKIYFPRMVMPAGSVLVSFMDFLIATGFLAVMMAWYHFVPPAQIIFLPVFVLLVFLAALGTGLWLSALMVNYRDFRFIVPFMVQFGLYAAPVITMTRQVPEKWRLLYALNPMVGIIDGFRWCILGGANVIYGSVTGLAVLVVVIITLTGAWYFRAMERSFADHI
jgi:lipopolysaccharide transport system permease protein